MTISVDFREEDNSARLARGGVADDVWDTLTKGLHEFDPGAYSTHTEAELSWPRFLDFLRTLRHLRERDGFQVAYGPGARSRVESFVAQAQLLARAQKGSEPSGPTDALIDERLKNAGWDSTRRQLTREQRRDLRRVVAYAHGANFSVPGAGKTTVALAAHLFTADADTTLLVVAPKNAFAAWDEALDDCLRRSDPHFLRLIGGEANIRLLLAQRPRRAIMSYGQLIRVVDLVASFMQRTQVHLILDESHRIKGGGLTQSGEAVQELAPLAVRRDVLSGTPMPNSSADLASQFDFLWPSQGLGLAVRTSTSVRDAIRPFYVRTTQSELGLPEPVVTYTPVDMSDSQKLLYGLLRDDALRQLSGVTRMQLPAAARRSVMRLLQAAIDPQDAVRGVLAGRALDLTGEPLRTIARLVLEEELSPRMQLAETQVRALASRGEKSVVWIPFVASVERLANRLTDLGAVVIHGGVETGDEAEDDTREGILRRFHEDASCLVLVANPAAGGEGISLHHVCHNAIYVGRTFNAAHYLQSRHRIHRLGLAPDAVTRIEVLEARAPARFGSVDLSVRRRLNQKIAQMWAVLNDPDLRALSLESDIADPTLEDGLSFDDVSDLMRELTPQVASN